MSGDGVSVALASRVRWLAPGSFKIFEGTFSLLHCAVPGEPVYVGVFAVRLFPVSYPGRFVSLCYADLEGKTREIGVIDDLAACPAEDRELIRKSLERHYHERMVTRVLDVRCQHGLLFFEVETQRGRESFTMRWRHDRTEDYSRNGKVLLDVDENRYVIQDVAALPQADVRRLTRYVYW